MPNTAFSTIIEKTSLCLTLVFLIGSLQQGYSQEYVTGKKLNYKTRAIGNSWIGTVGKHMQNHITNITVLDDGTVRTSSPWDEGGNKCAEYKDGNFIRKADCNANSKSAIDKEGKTWTIENYYGRFLDIHQNHGGGDTKGLWRIDPVPTGSAAPFIKCSDGRELHTIADPTAIAINKLTGELLVADNSEAQNIKIFDISGEGEPALTGTFGVEGGVYAGPNPGAKDDPLKFNGITGVGTDIEGNIYVSLDGFPGSQAEGGGSDLRAFDPNGTLRWRMAGLMFVTAASVDPHSGGDVIYDAFTRYKVDYTKEPQNNMVDWTDEALTINPFEYPDDPRLVGAVNTTLAIVYVNGNKYMFSTDMYNEPLFVHKFNGHIAVPVAVITAGYGWNGDEVIKFRWKHNRGRPDTPRWMWVDQNGDGLAQPEEFELFELGGVAERNFVRAIDIDRDGNIMMSNQFGYWLLPTNGFDENGIPKYSAKNIQKIDGSGYNPRAMKWLDKEDIMIAGEGEHTHMSKIHVYENWSDPVNRSEKFTIEVPSPSTSFSPQGGAFNIAADDGYIYISYSVRAGPNTGKEGEVLVYNLDDGAYMGYITPGTEVGSYSGWIDMRQATFAFAKPNGERIITVEEDGVGKVLIYEWCPPGEDCKFECSIQVDSVVISPSDLILDGYQSSNLEAMVYPDTICFNKVYWKSMDESVVKIDNKGRITSTGAGITEIRAISEQQPDMYGSVDVIVNYVAVESIIMETDSVTIGNGESRTLQATLTPVNAINKEISWKSSEESIITVDSNGEITGVALGNAWVTATAIDGNFVDSTNVEVIPVPVTGISFRIKHMGLWVGDTLNPVVDIIPANAGDKGITWEILNDEIATVSETGLVTGIMKGTTELKVISVDGGFTDSIRVQVLSEDEFANLDIGNLCAEGSFSVSDQNYMISGYGIDIWHGADEFHYAYQRHTGNMVMIAHVKNLDASDSWAKTGIMIRETLEEDSKHVNVVITPGQGASFQWRSETAGASDHTTTGQIIAPIWLKVLRNENVFSGYYSKNGTSWIELGTQTIVMKKVVHVGFSATAHSSSCVSNTSVYDFGLISDNIDTIPDISGFLSNDASLSDLKIDGKTVTDFNSSVYNYDVLLPGNTTEFPKIVAIPVHENATITITEDALFPGSVTVKVTAEDGIEELVYILNFSVQTSLKDFEHDILSIYPNPANDYLNLLMRSNMEKTIYIKIYDITGSLMISDQKHLNPGENSYQIKVNQLSNGIYILETGDKLKVRMKILINR